MVAAVLTHHPFILQETILKTIQISRQKILIAIVLGVITAAGILLIQNWPFGKESDMDKSIDDSLASSAAVFTTQNVFQIDYREGHDAWLKRICEQSTPAGCDLIKMGAEGMWEKYLDTKSVISATVQPISKLADNGSEQVWKLDITLSSPLPGSNKTKDSAYVAMAKSDGAWKFDRFLMQAEINALLARQKNTNPTPDQEK